MFLISCVFSLTSFLLLMFFISLMVLSKKSDSYPQLQRNNDGYSSIANFDYLQSPRLLHMDVWSQNILVDSTGHVTGLVDFDRAVWGDPEIEFAVLDYCGISQRAFWQGYGRERAKSTSAVIRQWFYLLYEVQKYMPIAVWRRQDQVRALFFKQKSLALANNLL